MAGLSPRTVFPCQQWAALGGMSHGPAISGADLLHASFAGDISEVWLDQWGTELVKPRESASLMGVVCGRPLWDHAWSWVSQPPGKALEWLGLIQGNTNLQNNSVFRN